MGYLGGCHAVLARVIERGRTYIAEVHLAEVLERAPVPARMWWFFAGAE